MGCGGGGGGGGGAVKFIFVWIMMKFLLSFLMFLEFVNWGFKVVIKMIRVGLVLYRYIIKNRVEIVGNEIFVVIFVCFILGFVND